MSQPPGASYSLADWLVYLESLHPKPIALGLDRVARVAARLDLAPKCPVVTVTGTNGKGSICTYLDAILRSGGYRVGLYTSPHLLRYNERVRIDGVDADDAALIEAFRAIEGERGGIPLTYFEFGTLAALWLFARAQPDALVLEVGLGGRLDAVNVVDADVAIISGIAIDHVDYLGGTREAIGFEKAGIMRGGRPAVCAEPDPPHTLLDHARDSDARLFRIGADYGYVGDRNQWQFWMRRDVDVVRRHGLPVPALRGSIQLRNAATALTAIELLAPRVAVTMGAIRDGIVNANLPARFQVLPGRPSIVLDVAHNPQAAGILATNLGDMGFFPETYGVFSMLGDKDIAGVAAELKNRITRWFIAPSTGPRGASVERIESALVAAGVAENAITRHVDVATATGTAAESAGDADRIVIFGSFVTVAAALQALETMHRARA